MGVLGDTSTFRILSKLRGRVTVMIASILRLVTKVMATPLGFPMSLVHVLAQALRTSSKLS